MPKEKNHQKMNDSESFIYVPNFIVFDEDELPESVRWQTGKRYRVEIVVEKTGERQNDGSANMISSFKIVSAKPKYEEGPEYLRKLVGSSNMKVKTTRPLDESI